MDNQNIYSQENKIKIGYKMADGDILLELGIRECKTPLVEAMFMLLFHHSDYKTHICQASARWLKLKFGIEYNHQQKILNELVKLGVIEIIPSTRINEPQKVKIVHYDLIARTNI